MFVILFFEDGRVSIQCLLRAFFSFSDLCLIVCQYMRQFLWKLSAAWVSRQLCLLCCFVTTSSLYEQYFTSNISSREEEEEEEEGWSSSNQTQSTRHKKSKSLHLHLKCLIVELMSLKIWLKYDRPLVNEISKDFSMKLEMTKIVVMFHD